MAFTLNDADDKRGLAFARMHAALPASAYAFLTATGGAWDAPIAGGTFSVPDPPTAAELDLSAIDPKLLRDDIREPDARVHGSNAFAVAGALADGAAIVANDMHLDLRVPNLWFRTRIIYPDPRRAGSTIDVTGAGLPGAPAVVAGSNGHVAWGFTNSYADTTDWVRVLRDPADASRYRTTEGWATTTKHVETIHVHGASDETLEVEDTRWGPIIANDVDGTPLWLSVTAQEAGPGVFSGMLYSTSGPPFNAVPFRPADVVTNPVGTATVRFTDGDSGTLSYSITMPGGSAAQNKAITREVFRAPGTACQ